MHREEVPSADLGFSQLLLSFCQMSAAAAAKLALAALTIVPLQKRARFLLAPLFKNLKNERHL